MKKQMNGQKTHWLRNTLCVLIACGILGTILSAVLFLTNPQRTYASASVQFSFDGAAEGLAPNGYSFDISAVSSDVVLEKALDDAGMADRYTAEIVSGQIETSGIYPEDIVRQMMNYESLLDFSANRTLTLSDYHPTLYTVKLYNGFDSKISKGDLEKLLHAIMDSYKAYFSEVYAAGKNSVTIAYNLADYDYPQQLTILTTTMEDAIAYADEMYEKEPALRLNGQGFNDISVRLHSLIDTDISKLSADITMNALTKNTSRLITQYDYEIRSLTNQLNKKNDQLAQLDALVASYDKNEIIYLSTADSLTKIDGNSSETYDALVANRREVADEITTINNQISNYRLLLTDLTGDKETEEAKKVSAAPAVVSTSTEKDGTEGEGTVEEIVVPEYTQEELEERAKAAAENTAKQVAALEANISALVTKREAVMKDFASLIQQYNDKYVNDATVSIFNYQYKAPSLLSGTFIKQVIKTAGVFCVIGLIVCLILLIHSRRKEEKA